MPKHLETKPKLKAVVKSERPMEEIVAPDEDERGRRNYKKLNKTTFKRQKPNHFPVFKVERAKALVI